MDEWEEHILESVYEENVHGWEKARLECSAIVERLAALAAEVKSEAFSKKVEPTEVMRNEAWAVLLSYIARFGEPKEN
jgi:hypothetical protein